MKTNRGSRVSRPIRSSNRTSNQVSTGRLDAATSRASFRPTLPPSSPPVLFGWQLASPPPLVSAEQLGCAERSRATWRGEKLGVCARPAPAISRSPLGPTFLRLPPLPKFTALIIVEPYTWDRILFNDGSPDTRQSLSSLVRDCSLLSELTFSCFPCRSAAAADALHPTRLSVPKSWSSPVISVRRLRCKQTTNVGATIAAQPEIRP